MAQAQIIKRLCLPVGSYEKTVSGQPQVQHEYREIGVLIEFTGDNGNKWQEIKLNLDILNPSMLLLARTQVQPKTSAAARVKLFDVARKQKDPTAPTEPEGQVEDDGIPY
jgi:hypothetical protein